MGVYQKGNRWYIDYYLPEGRRKREVVGHVDKITRSLAEKALKARAGEIVQGKFNLEKAKKPILFDKLLERYLGWAKDNHKAPENDTHLTKPLLAYFEGKTLSSITPWLVEKYKSERKAQGKTPATINRELTVLKRMFNLACEWGLATSNPVSRIKFMQIPKEIPRTLKDWEFARLYQAAPSHLKPVLLTGYLTGMRKGEILKLKWGDIDFEMGYILVRDSKNNEARAIPIDETLKKELLGLKERATCKYVFTYEGKPMKSLRRSWYTTLKHSGIDKCTFHHLRHTFASNLVVGQKEDIITVMELTGHKDIRMLKRYSHTREEYKKKAIKRLGDSLKLEVIDTSLDTTPFEPKFKEADIIELSKQK